MTKDTFLLGISAYFHDAAAALIKNGEIIAAAQEERFSRKKGDSSFPGESIKYCLNEAGIEMGNVGYVAYYECPQKKFDRLMHSFLAYAPDNFASFKQAMPAWVSQRMGIKNEIVQSLGKEYKNEVYFTNHHESHAASAFYPSPFGEAAIITLDAVGEWSTSCIGVGMGNKIEIQHEMQYPHSIGMLYSAFTYYCGFKVNSGEYKLMGLAPYGEPIFAEKIKENVVDLHDDGSITLNMDYFDFAKGYTIISEKFNQLFEGPALSADDPIEAKHLDIAASIQQVTEDIVLRIAARAREITGKKSLVMAGGVALNCVANGKLGRADIFDDIWIQPAAGDSGGALGAALLMWYQLFDNARQVQKPDAQKGSFLGPAYENKAIRLYLDAVGADYKIINKEEELIDQTARLLADEKVIGWFQGRMEYGPRALGHRSIIGDARSEKMQQIMNVKIKFRESFRPFAPCVLREHAHEYFEMEEEQDSPYMLFVAPVKDSRRRNLTLQERKEMQDSDLRKRVAVPRSDIPAVTHVDYSARVQTVDEQRHGRYYRMMSRFHQLTGSPVIINTSFNIRGEPIVCTPEDAYRCFIGTDMDCLVMENFILMKEDQPDGLLLGIENYRKNMAPD